MDQQRKVVLFIACSLDGYIATKQDGLEWLFSVDGQEESTTIVEEFEQTIDTLIMGRKTYDWAMNELDGEYPYEDKENYIFSRTVPQVSSKGITFTAIDPTELIQGLKNQAGKNIWLMGGGELIADFLEADLIDKMIITIAPILLGKGIPLFKEGNYEMEWELTNVRQIVQFAELTFERKSL